MSTIFPENPEVNDEYNGYRWNGVAWQIIGIDLTAEYPVITNGTISDSAVPQTVARTDSPEFTGTVILPQTTSIGEISHTEIMSLAGVSGSIQSQLNLKAPLDNPTFTTAVSLPSNTAIGNVSAEEISYLNGVSGSIQVQIDSKATPAYVDSAVSTAIANVIAQSPSTLDTLNELAIALNNDPNFATTITNALAGKLNSVPGIINQYAGTALPTGYLWCEGQEVLISTYQDLYNAITSSGTVFPYGANTNGSGGAGTTHFRIPNLKGRVPVGKDSAQTEFNVLGETGGAKTHTLTSSEMPSHTHTQNEHGHSVYDPGHRHAISRKYGGTGFDITYTTANTWQLGSADTGATVQDTNASGTSVSIYGSTATNQNTGGDGAHNNLQPYITLNYIIKY